jgi:hypothetical protein
MRRGFFTGKSKTFPIKLHQHVQCSCKIYDG